MTNKLGWEEPVFYGVTDDGQPIAAFSPEQFDRLKAGYICPKCWQGYSVILPKCLVCQYDMSQNLDPQIVEYPEDWVPGDDRTKQRA